MLLIISILLLFPDYGQGNNGRQTSAADKIMRTLDGSGVEAAWKIFETMRSDEKERYKFDEEEFNTLGYRFIGMGKIAEAVAVFRMNAAQFPESANAHSSLGEGYIFLGKRGKAVFHYKKSLALNPGNWNAEMNLGRMNGFIEDARNETREKLAYASGENTGLKGAYLGQAVPGLKPEAFAPGIISTRGHFEYHLIVSPRGKEIYLGRRGSGIMVCRLEKDGWTAPEVMDISDKYDAFEPHITWDGRRMFFGSGMQIMMMERTKEQWSAPSVVLPGMYATTARDGTLYITDITTDSPYGVIAASELVDGKYTQPRHMEGGLNMPHGSAHPCIAPDERFIIFDALIPGQQEGGDRVDLFVCFQEDDGTWGEAVNFGPEINTPGGNICASLSPDGKYLFYLANRDIYWVSTGVIERLDRSTRGRR